MRCQRGFSLLELLVTVVVMSILFAVAVSILRVDRGADTLTQKADAFGYFYQATADEAMLTGKLVRIITQQHQDGVQLIPQSRQSNGKSWTRVRGDLDAFVLAKPLSLELSATPTLFPSGQSNNFTAIFALEANRIVLSIDGMARIKRVQE